MDGKQIAMLIARHDHPRKRDNLSWEQYLYRAIAQHTLSMSEIVEIAYSVGLSPEIQAELEIRCYARVGAVGAVERATARYTALFANRGGV